MRWVARGGLVLAGALATLTAFTAGAWADAADPPAARRVAGVDRYATAADIAATGFPAGADRVYVATGRDFPDALAIAPVAGRVGAPILLVDPQAVPDATRTELQRLAPDTIVVIGGEAAVSPAVANQLQSLTGATVSRISGSDRFATAASISAETFAPGVEKAFIATGLAFPDALAGGIAAGAADGPVLLAAPSTLPEATRAELVRLQPQEIVILGGSAAIGDAIEAELAELTSGDVMRLAGPDRYATAAAISEATFPAGTGTVYLATGANFPDALTGVPAAVRDGATLVLTTPGCAPEPTRAEIARLGAAEMVVLGGTTAISDAAADLVGCTPMSELPPVTVAVDAALEPLAGPPADAPDGTPRTIASIADARGNQVDFVADELLLMGDDAALQASVERFDGEVLQVMDEVAVATGASTWLVRVPPAAGDPDALGAALKDLDPRNRGAHTISSAAAVGLIHTAAAELRRGVTVGLNFLHTAVTVADRDVAEAPTAASSISGYDPNPFTWSYLNAGATPDIGVTEAWRAIALAGDADPASREPIAILDAGCAPNPDLPPGSMGWDSAPNTEPRAATNPILRWHCTHVATTAVGLIDNGQQAAGTGGQVARAVMFPGSLSVDGALMNLSTAATAGIKITNMSFGARIPASVSGFLGPFQTLLSATRTAGVLHLAAAGNDSENVDAVDCFVVCWEEAVHQPCELGGVVCIGGLGSASIGRDPGSNWGNESVDLWAPYNTYSGAAPDDTRNRVRPISGTSFATPYVAGIAAMLRSLDPGLDGPAVEQILRDTARPGTGFAGDYVHAFDAVLTRYGGNAPPELEITSPADGGTALAGRLLSVRAATSDADGSAGPVQWRLDGALAGSGAQTALQTDRDDLGNTIVSARVSDGPYVVTDAVTITLENDPPSVTMLSPSSLDVYYESQRIVLRAQSEDRNYPPDDELPDSALRWERTNPTIVLGYGHLTEIDASVLGIGNHIVRVVADDGYATDIAAVAITVEADPENVPPTAQIVLPEAGDQFLPGGNPGVQFEGNATDTEDGALSGESLVWTTTYDADKNGSIEPDEEDIFLGTGESFTGMLQASAACNTTYTHTVRLTATDSGSATGTDEVVVTVRINC